MSAHDTLEVVVHAMSIASERRPEGTLLIELRAADPAEPLPPYQAGAHIDVHLGGLIRQYSLLGDPGQPGRYLIGVLRERESRGGSRAIHERLRVGDTLTISAPRNTFPLDESAGYTVLLGGGIGITPLVAMAERLDALGAPFEFHVYAADEASLPLAEHLAARPWAARVRRHYSAAGDSFRTAAPDAILDPPPGAAVYVCGPPAFIDAAVERTASWPEGAVHVERFALAEPVVTDGASFTVIAASSGQEMPVGEHETIAEVLERNGYEVFLSCEQGICGSCLTGVVAGIPDHRDEVQTAAEHAANTQINVCCSRARTPTLTLDI